MRRQYVLFLKDILEAMERIEEFVGTTDFEGFAANDQLKSAVVWKLVTIGEAAKNVPAHVRKQHTHTPRSSMARMRDGLAHAYFIVDDEIVWKVVREELPRLKPAIREIYEHERGHP